MKKKRQYKSSSKNYCDNCEGVGWVEGGQCIQTTCWKCKGSGILVTKFWMEKSILQRETSPYEQKAKKKNGKGS